MTLLPHLTILKHKVGLPRLDAFLAALDAAGVLLTILSSLRFDAFLTHLIGERYRSRRGRGGHNGWRNSHDSRRCGWRDWLLRVLPIDQ